jgi:hypothetical protein
MKPLLIKHFRRCLPRSPLAGCRFYIAPVSALGQFFRGMSRNALAISARWRYIAWRGGTACRDVKSRRKSEDCSSAKNRGRAVTGSGEESLDQELENFFAGDEHGLD